MKRVVPDSPELNLMGVSIFEDFFPLDVLCELARFTMTRPDRKTEIQLDDWGRFPDPLERAALLIESEVDLPHRFNIAIPKRYAPDEWSDAYNMHSDPVRFQDRIALCSLGNIVALEAYNPHTPMYDPFLYPCFANTVVVMPPV